MRAFHSPEEALFAYEKEEVTLHEPVLAKINGEIMETTTGRIIFNEAIPKELGFFNEIVGKKQLGQIVSKCYSLLGEEITAAMLDEIKRLGFAYSTKAGVTIGVTDIVAPQKKDLILQAAENKLKRFKINLDGA